MKHTISLYNAGYKIRPATRYVDLI